MSTAALSGAPGTAPGRSWQRPAAWFLAGLTLVAATMKLLGVSESVLFVPHGVLNGLAYGSAATVCLLRGTGTTKQERRSAAVIATAIAVYGAGNVAMNVTLGSLAGHPFPSWPDWALFCGYPFAIAAVVAWTRRYTDRARRVLLLDGLTGGLALGAFAAATAFGPILAVGGRSWAALVTALAYPLLDVVMLVTVVVLLSVLQWRPPLGIWFFVAAVMLVLSADVIYLLERATGGDAFMHVVEGVRVLAALAAALSPGWTSRSIGLHAPGWALIALPLGSTVGALTLLVVNSGSRINTVAVALSAAAILIALTRLGLTVHEVRALAESRRLAHTDELTGLANRRALYDEGPDLIAASDPEGSVALLLLDLDRFKEVNDSLGHLAGDQLLNVVAERLRAFVPDDAALVARLGGDEFALLCCDADAETASHLSDAVREVIGQAVDVDGVGVHIDVSIGVAMLPAASADLPTLHRQADVAMYHAKGQRLGTVAYDPADDEFASGDRLASIELLRDAIESRSLLLHYQPKIDRESGRATCVEALVRWEHPERGVLTPDAFLPLVEHAGLMTALTQAVFETALDQAAIWHRGGRPLTVAVNLSAASLDDHELPERIAAMLAERDLPGSALEIEILEDFLMGDRSRAQTILNGLRAQGIRVSIDDFGTGYSSLSYLRELPVDELKLDKAFLDKLHEDPRALALVQSTVLLAHSLGLRLVAEGVEDALTSLELTEAGFDVQQGWYYSKALTPTALEKWLDEQAPEQPTTQERLDAALEALDNV